MFFVNVVTQTPGTGREDKKLKKLKLSMTDTVSLVRNISLAARCVSNVETVIIHDLCLGREEWEVLGKVLASKEKTLKRLELFQILGVTEDNIAEIALCIVSVPEVRLSSFCSIPLFWSAISHAVLSQENNQLDLLEVVSTSVQPQSLASFCQCVLAIPQVRLMKVKLGESWSRLVEELTSSDKVVSKLWLTECWIPDQVVEQLHSLDSWGVGTEEGGTLLNNNYIVLNKM